MGVQSDFVVFFSKELQPVKGPDGIKFVRLNTTSINATWTPLSLFEARGFPMYKVTLSPVSNEIRRKRWSSNSSIVITENNYALFTNLKDNQDYVLTVGVTCKAAASSDYTNSQPIRGIVYIHCSYSSSCVLLEIMDIF